MDSDTLNSILEVIFFGISLINLIMWYFYGAIDSINFDNFINDDEKKYDKLFSYSESYHTNLLALNMLIFGFATYLSTNFKFSYIYVIVLVILTMIFKHLGYHKA